MKWRLYGVFLCPLFLFGCSAEKPFLSGSVFQLTGSLAMYTAENAVIPYDNRGPEYALFKAISNSIQIKKGIYFHKRYIPLFRVDYFNSKVNNFIGYYTNEKGLHYCSPDDDECIILFIPDVENSNRAYVVTNSFCVYLINCTCEQMESYDSLSKGDIAMIWRNATVLEKDCGMRDAYLFLRE